jgi:hypothetical protein
MLTAAAGMSRAVDAARANISAECAEIMFEGAMLKFQISYSPHF